MKKIHSLIPVTLVALFAVSCSASKPKVAFEMHVSSKPITTEYFEYDFDLAKYTVLEDSPVVDKAIVAMMFCANIAPSSLLKFENSQYSSKDCDDYLPLYQELKLDDFVTQKIESKNSLDLNDQSLMNLAHKKVTNNGKEYDIGFFSIIDSGGGVQWVSNFDVGYDNDLYNSTTGEHPEWTDHLAHKGFDVTSNRCVSVLEEYIASKMDKSAEQVFYVYGHSRGGAVGNLVAKKLIDKGYNTTAYLFAGPNTTTASDVAGSKYNKIFNYTNEKDIITMIPSSSWGFTRYGQTTTFDGTLNKEHFKEINHVSMPSGNLNIVPQGLDKIANSREAMYVLSDKFVIASKKNLESQEKVNEFVNSYLDALNEDYEDCEGFIKTDIAEEGGKYSVTLTTCPALFTSLFSRVISTVFSLNMDGVPEGLSPFLQPFLKAAEFSNSDLLYIASMMNFILYNHYYHSYIPYFVK